MEGSEGGIGAIIGLLVTLAIPLFYLICAWKVYTKAGKPGWAALIPIYNVFVFLQIIKRPLWWFILFLIPIVNFIIAIVVCLDLAESFGKSKVWGFFMICILSVIGYPILAFSDAKYQEPAR